MSNKQRIIWSNVNLDFEDWKSDLRAEYPDETDERLIEKMYETNNDYLGDERLNLDIQLPRSIIVIADLGLWNGRKSGYKIIESGNIKDCLYSSYDMTKWYVDDKGEFRCDDYHHDGTNYYTYRGIKDTATDDEIEELKNLIYNNLATEDNIDKVTFKLGDRIAKVYGW